MADILDVARVAIDARRLISPTSSTSLSAYLAARNAVRAALVAK